MIHERHEPNQYDMIVFVRVFLINVDWKKASDHDGYNL